MPNNDGKQTVNKYRYQNVTFCNPLPIMKTLDKSVGVWYNCIITTNTVNTDNTERTDSYDGYQAPCMDILSR